MRLLNISEVIVNTDFRKHLKSDIFKTNKMKVITENQNVKNSQFKLSPLE